MVGKGTAQKRLAVMLLWMLALSTFLHLPDCHAGTIVFYDTKGLERCKFVTELAVTESQHARGLMHRVSLRDDTGMLFIFNNEELRHFWMRNTLIPLDLVFIDSQRIVVSVHCDARPLDESAITSRFPARYVLEINAGLVSKCGIGSGMRVRFDNLPQ
ncbi:MAG: hypothetical protein A4E65_00509 [Syntrophorhabdus sp. PtaU1.Bin153]|nr:MAG: hypothetical protein A4E65_00509 [Syntrophorhabdus sp. PtaU1.Bin153]